jgi:hypothetical protein
MSKTLSTREAYRKACRLNRTYLRVARGQHPDLQREYAATFLAAARDLGISWRIDMAASESRPRPDTLATPLRVRKALREARRV